MTPPNRGKSGTDEPRLYTDEDRAREQRMMDVAGRYQRERDRARSERDDARRRLDAMTAARDHCKRQTTEAGDRLVAANVEISRLRQLLAEAGGDDA